MIRVLLLAFALTACGGAAGFGGKSKDDDKDDEPAHDVDKEDVEAEEQDRHSMYVATADDLPDCDEDGEGWLIYVKDDEKFQACLDGDWEDVDMPETRIIASISCAGQLEGEDIHFTYQLQQMSSGDVFASATIYDMGFQVSSAQFWSLEQEGFDNAPVLMASDLVGAVNGGYWTVGVDRKTLITAVVYKDADVAGGTMAWTMTADKCVADEY